MLRQDEHIQIIQEKPIMLRWKSNGDNAKDENQEYK